MKILHISFNGGLTFFLKLVTFTINLQYAVVFDGGSSHTSMAVYQWLADTITEYGTGVASQLAFESSCGEAGMVPYSAQRHTPQQLMSRDARFAAHRY